MAIGFGANLSGASYQYRRQHWYTTACDVRSSKLIDVVKTRDFAEGAAWATQRPTSFRVGIRVGTLDISNNYATVLSVTLPEEI